MPPPKNALPAAPPLRLRAETRLQRRREPHLAGNGAARSTADSQRLLHELQVHQIELEMQNEELRKARDEMEAGLDKYSELYDFAPVGYLTLDREGAISEANLTAASLLGIPRAPLVQQRLALFVTTEDRPLFRAYVQQVFEGKLRKECDVRLLVKGKPGVNVRLRANLFASGQACRMTMVDVTAQKLVESVTAQLAAIVTSSSDAIIGRDLSGNITSWNAGAEMLFGYGAGEMVGGSIARLVPPALQAEEADMRQRVQRGDHAEHFETVRLAKDGRPLTMSVTLSPIRQAGRIAGISKVARDITGQKLAGDMLRVSEIRYRRLFEAAHDGVLLLDPGTRKITDANPFMTTLLGYRRDQLVGMELFEIGLLKDEAASQEMFRKLKRKHEVRYEHLPLESKTGRHQEVEVVANVYEENGRAVIQCNIRDITVRKRAEDALRRNEALFAALIQQAPMGVYVVDARLRMAQVNPKALPIFQKIHPLLGRNFVEVINVLWSRPVAASIMRHFRHTLLTGEPYQSPEFSERRRDTGADEVYEWQIQRVTLPGGEHGVVCFFNNITERKQAEETQRRLAVLAAANREANLEISRRRVVEKTLRASEEVQRGLLAESRTLHTQLRHLTRDLITAQEDERKKISRELHDDVMQTLVGINVALAALTKRTTVDPAAVKSNIARTQRLVKSSLKAVHRFARDLRPAVLDDFGLLPALQAYGKSLAARKKFRIRLTAIGEIDSLDSIQRTTLFRVTQEALSNVARHARATVVKVRLTRLPRAVRLEVHDDGKSFRVKSTLTPGKNKRLGLLGMRERVEMIGGTLAIESVPGRGTLVRAEIPLHQGGRA